jgi:F-type H+-transporting ATPase subunit epsilon
MADPLHVELVSAERVVWSGEATIVITRTADGDIGIMPNHAPILSVLVEGTVEIRTDTDEYLVAAVGSGFLSVANNRVSLLVEHAEMSGDIDVERARRELEQAEAADRSDERQQVAAREAQARIRAVEKAT